MAELSEIEKSISDLEKQIAYLEEQRRTLTFSSPEEEAEADRALADLKLRYADAVAAYRKSQSSRSRQSVSSVKPSKKRDPVAIVCLVLGVLALVFFAFVYLVPAIFGPAHDAKREQLMKNYMGVIEQSYPGHCSYEWDKESRTFTVFVWDQDIKTVGLSAKSLDFKSRSAWSDICDLFSDLSESIQQKFREAGFVVSVSVCAVDPANHDTVYIMANNGRLLYDAVNG